MTSPLENLAGTGRALVQEPMDSAEFEGLLRSGRARLVDARNASLALESRFDLAYNAAHTLALGPEVWRVLDKCHHMRNVAEYEGALDVEERIVADLIVA